MRAAKKTEVLRSGNKLENIHSAKRSYQDMYKIVRYLYKSFIAQEPSLKDKMKLSMGCFDSEASIKQQDIVSFKIPPPLSHQNCLLMPQLNMTFYRSMLCVYQCEFSHTF